MLHKFSLTLQLLTVVFLCSEQLETVLIALKMKMDITYHKPRANFSSYHCLSVVELKRLIADICRFSLGMLVVTGRGVWVCHYLFILSDCCQGGEEICKKISKYGVFLHIG